MLSRAGSAPVDSIESSFIERAQAGDGEAFDLLVVRHVRRVTALAWTITRSADAAEEIAQETFVRAWQSLHRFRAGSPLEPWLLRIAVNLSVDHLRRGKRFEPLHSASEPGTADELSPERQALAAETARRIDEALSALPMMQQVVARLALVEEYDHDQIAGMTGLTAGTVRSHLSLARGKLRAILKER